MSRSVIVCVDDESVVLESLRAELREALGTACLIEIASSGEEALELIEDLNAEGHQVAVVISDHIMPGMKGDELLIHVRRYSPQTLAILLTGQASLTAIANVINQVGLYRYLSKPWQSEDLCLTVVTAIERYHQDQQLSHKTQQLEAIVTQLQEKEQLLQEVNQGLEQRVSERTQALSQALAELQSAQGAIIESEKMAALGQLIAGIAHEINTPMGVIRSALGNMAKALERTLTGLPRLYQQLSPTQRSHFQHLLDHSRHDQDPLSTREERHNRRQLTQTLQAQGIPHADTIARQLVSLRILTLDDILQSLITDPIWPQMAETAISLDILYTSGSDAQLAVEKASKIVFALKTYAHHDITGEKSRIQLANSIEVVLTLYRHTLKHGIEVTKHYDPLPDVLCYPDELHQVWTNLLFNAIQAMNHQGRLDIDLTQVGDSARITFTDSGPGIPAEVQPKIFQPFFTTKAAGEGSGLGLSIVRQIIDKHNGSIEVDSQPGRTVFEIHLPFS